MTLETKTHLTILEYYFQVKEICMPGTISAGIAVTDKDKTGRHRVVTERYLDPKTRYITQDDLDQQGLYIDHYEESSIPIVAKIDGLVVASFRIIPNTPEAGLPINNSQDIKIDPMWTKIVQGAEFELSQFAKDRKFHTDPRPAIAVIKAYMGITEKGIGNKHAIAVIDDRIIETLNGPYTGFDLPKIGPSVHYLGSNSTPVFIDIDNVRSNSRKNGNPNLADFLEGKSGVKGYEWYTGP